IERELSVHVIAKREVITKVLDVAAIRRTVAKELAHAEARSENSTATPGPDVLEDEREPQYRDFTDVQNRGPRDHDVLRDHLDLVGAEVVIGDRVVAARDSATPDVERGLTAAGRIAHERGGLSLHEPVLPGLSDLRRDIRHNATVQLDVVCHLTTRDDVGRLLLRIAEDDRVTAGDDDLGRIVVNDAVSDECRLVAINAGLFTLEREASRLRVEYRLIALIPRRGVAGPRHQNTHHGILFVPFDQHT